MSTRIDPERDAAIAFYNEGCMLVQRKSFQLAKEKFDEAVEKDPTYAKAWYNRALTCHHLGQLQEVKRSLEKVINIEPQHLGALNRLAIVSTNLDEFQDALDVYEKILAIDPTPGTWSNKGVVLTKLDQLEEAIEAFQKAIDTDPNYALAYYNIASVHARLENANKTVEYLEKAKEYGDINYKQKAIQDSDFSKILNKEIFVEYLREKQE